MGGVLSESESKPGHAVVFGGVVFSHSDFLDWCADGPEYLGGAAAGFCGRAIAFGKGFDGEMLGFEGGAMVFDGDPSLSAEATRGPLYGIGTIGAGRRVASFAERVDSGLRAA
jgi:hypothetical protein